MQQANALDRRRNFASEAVGPWLVSVGLGVISLGLPAAAQVPQAPFTIADPASTSRVFSFDSSVTHSTVTPIVPRITEPEPKHESLHDSATGALTEPFGTAYSYANPLYSTSHSGTNGVGLQGGGGGAQSAVISFVVARFGAPPDPLPRIAGIDLSPTQPDVALIRYGVDADGLSFPDIASAGIIDLAVHSMGRARITQIEIMPAAPIPDETRRAALLRQVALALVHQGVHPAAILSDGRRVLPRGLVERGRPVPGHVFSLVLLDRP